jgi:glucosyl-3-phosphoglycerate synthase
VETSHILDVYQKWGMKAFAQCDLDQRIHRNQSTDALGRMSFGILQSFINRLRSHGKIDTLAEISNMHSSYLVTGTEYEAVNREIIEEERPPIIEIPEYIDRFPLLSA